jgi:hypothetical protein
VVEQTAIYPRKIGVMDPIQESHFWKIFASTAVSHNLQPLMVLRPNAYRLIIGSRLKECMRHRESAIRNETCFF